VGQGGCGAVVELRDEQLRPGKRVRGGIVSSDPHAIDEQERDAHGITL
jgi:hypothetical protein